MDRAAYEAAVSRVYERLQEAGEVTVAQIRDDLDTSRKYALALLEFLDGQKITRRLGDIRVAGSKAEACASG
jgi:selenocysteine-specific elongation factor